MKGNILFTFNIFFLKWREKVEQQKHTYEIKQNIWRLWFYIYYIYIFFIHQFIIFIKTYSSIQNLSKYCFCLWMHCFWSMWTQHYKLCVHVESVSHRRKDNYNILNKFCFISNNTKKNTWLLLAELRFITIFLVHRTSLLLQKYRSRYIGYYRVRKRSWIPVAYAPVRCAQSVVVTNWAGNCDTRIWFWCNQLNVTRQCMLNVSWISQDLTHGICIAVQSLSCHKVDIY